MEAPSCSDKTSLCHVFLASKGLCHWKRGCHKLSCKQKKLQYEIIINSISFHLWKPPLAVTKPPFDMFSWHSRGCVTGTGGAINWVAGKENCKIRLGILNLISLDLWIPPLAATRPPFVMFSWHLPPRRYLYSRTYQIKSIVWYLLDDYDNCPVV